MVDLTQGGVTEAPTVTAEMPSVSYGGAFQRVPKSSIAPGLAAVGEGLDVLSADLAKQQGQHDAQEAVTRAPDGSLNVVQKPPPMMLGAAARAYNQAVDAGTIPFTNTITAQKMTEIRAQFANDPAGFAKASAAYADSLKQRWGGPLGQHAYEQATSVANQHYDNMLLTEQHRVAAENKAVLTGGIDDATNAMTSIARQSGLGAEKLEEFQKAKANFEGYYKQLTENPVFGYSADRAEQEKKRAYDNIQGAAVVGQVDQIYAKEGATAAAKKIDEGILNNTSLNLSDQQRQHLAAWGKARIAFLNGQNASQIAAMETTVKATVDGIRGGTIPDGVADQVVERLRGLGGADQVQQIEAARAAARAAAPLGMLAPGAARAAAMGGAGGVASIGGNPASEKSAIDKMVSLGWSPVQAAGIVGGFIHESGGSKLNPNAVAKGDGSDGSDSIGIGQWNGPRAVALKAYAASKGKPWNDLETQLEFAHRELQSNEILAGTALKAATTPEAAAAASLAFERPKGWQPGGNPAMALGWANRLAHAQRLAGGGASTAPIATSVNGVPFTDAQIKDNPYLLSEWVKRVAANGETQAAIGTSIGTAIENGLKANLAPAPDTLANFMQIASANPKQFADQQQRIVTSLAGMQVANGASNMAPSAGQAVIDQAMQRANGGSILQQQVALAAKQHFEANAKELADHPGYSAAKRGWISAPPQPLNLNDHQALAAGMAQRDQMATAIATHTGDASQSALQPADLAQVKSVMTNGNAQQKLALISSFGQLSKPTLDATLKQLANDETARPLAMAAQVAMNNPDAAKLILQGHELLKAEPKLGGDKDLAEREWIKSLPIADLGSAEIRRAISGSVEGAYAALSARDNDMTGVFKKDRYAEALKLVTGGVLDYRGSKIIAPWYGATEGHLSAAIGSLTPEDMKGAVAGDGTPFPAQMLKPSLGGMFSSGRYRLETRGNGKYLIFSGDDTARKYVQKQGGDAFVLDLGAKKSGATAPNMEFVGGPPASALLSKQEIWSAGARQQVDKAAPIPIDGGVVQ